MKKLLCITFIISAITMAAQTTEENTKDLWTHSIDVTLGDNWQKKTISVPGKGEPNVVDFFRAFAKAYPCEYHDLLVMALEGDEEVKFNHEKPSIRIDKDSCLLENGSFAMRVFYDKYEGPVALGVCCHQSLTTKQQDAYYYRYNKASRKLTPLFKGSDVTGGMVKRETKFHDGRDHNEATMIHRRGRCGIEGRLVWEDGDFVFRDNAKLLFKFSEEATTMSVLWNFLDRYGIELREPEPSTNEHGGSITSLPICVAVIKEASDDYVSAKAMEGFYYFYARGWVRADSTMLVAVYTECAPKFDYDWNQETKDGHHVKTPHKLQSDDEVCLYYYNCDNRIVSHLSPTSPEFAEVVGSGLPSLERNEWRCVLSPDNEDLVFVSETDGKTKVFKWDGNKLIEQ